MKRHPFHLSFFNLRIIPLILVTLFLSSCHKTCTCIEMNGREHVYTREEVEEANGGSCDEMIYLFNREAAGAILRFYSYCSWD